MRPFFSPNGRATEARTKYNEIICEAHKSGLSIMEITRVTGGTNPDFFYSVLRNAGLIKAMKRGRTPKIDLPHRIAKVFEQKNFSFPKWCHVWNFSIETARTALEAELPSGDAGKFAFIHKAFRRDFPERYANIFPGSELCQMPVIRLKAGLIPPDTDQIVSMTWSKDGEHYLASLYGEEGIEGIGESWIDAVRDLQQVWWIHKGAMRLTNAIKSVVRSSNGTPAYTNQDIN